MLSSLSHGPEATACAATPTPLGLLPKGSCSGAIWRGATRHRLAPLFHVPALVAFGVFQGQTLRHMLAEGG